MMELENRFPRWVKNFLSFVGFSDVKKYFDLPSF